MINHERVTHSHAAVRVAAGTSRKSQREQRHSSVRQRREELRTLDSSLECVQEVLKRWNGSLTQTQKQQEAENRTVKKNKKKRNKEFIFY